MVDGAVSLVPLVPVVPVTFPAKESFFPSPSPSSEPFLMIILVGSSSNVPVKPFTALASTLPRNTRFSLPDTSTNPPSPDSLPPLAETSP